MSTAAIDGDLLTATPDELHQLGFELCQAGRYRDAEVCYRRAIELQQDFPEAHNNLGFVLRMLGRAAQAESSIRYAVKADPNNADFQCNLGETLLLLGRPKEAEACFLEALRIAPEAVGAAIGLGHIAQLEGRFKEAESIFGSVLRRHPRMPGLMARLSSLRKMTPEDAPWLEAARSLASDNLRPPEEAALRFAMGKYWDDLGEFANAFESYERANQLLKTTAARYQREARVQFVEDLIRVYSPGAFDFASTGASESTKPLFVVGMPRSGTSLVEQIIASHPEARGAGELGFWTEVVIRHSAGIRSAVLAEPLRRELATAYLQLLDGHGREARRVVDKAPVNAEFLGLIHTVFPQARIIYVRRNAIDTCLSCYFQNLPTALSYTMDLSDLAHYCRTHYRLMAHWCSVLPRGTLLEVPYEQLVADQEGWTRKMLDFIGLPLHGGCLEFHRTPRSVATASSWQVRQKIYKTSVERWRNYEPFIGPLLGLNDLLNA